MICGLRLGYRPKPGNTGQHRTAGPTPHVVTLVLAELKFEGLQHRQVTKKIFTNKLNEIQLQIKKKSVPSSEPLMKTSSEYLDSPKLAKANRADCDSDSEWSEVRHPENWKGLPSSWTCEQRSKSPPAATKIIEDAAMTTIQTQLTQLQVMQDKLQLELALLTQAKNSSSSRTRSDHCKIHERVNKPKV